MESKRILQCFIFRVEKIYKEEHIICNISTYSSDMSDCTFSKCNYQPPKKNNFPEAPTYNPNGERHPRILEHTKDRHQKINYEFKRGSTTVAFERDSLKDYKYLCICGSAHASLRGVKRHVLGDLKQNRGHCHAVRSVTDGPTTNNFDENERIRQQLKDVLREFQAHTSTLRELLEQYNEPTEKKKRRIKEEN